MSRSTQPSCRPRGTHMLRLIMLVLVCLACVLPATAGAHATLESSEPAAQAVLDAAPDEITLIFTGSVTTGKDSITVFAPDESNVAVGEAMPHKGARITQPIAATQSGTYGVSYRVSSEDGHVMTGALTFVVGEAGADDAAAAQARDAAKVDRSLQLAFSTGRFVEILALLIASGTGIFAALLAPGWRPRLLIGSLLILLLAYAFGYIIDTAIVRGISIGALDREALIDTADTPFGLSLQIRALIAIVALGPALLLRYGPPLPVLARWAVAVVFAGLAASLSITGHAVTTDPMWLRMPLDMVHVIAAAIWVGGLLQLAFLAPFATTQIDAVQRFSHTAFASVMVLLLTGAYATYAELGMHPSELLDSRYGRLIVGKLVLYLGTMPLAFNNMHAFVPQLRRRPEDAPRLLRQYVWREFSLLLVIIGLTVWLIATPQPI
ncbi:MAG: copper resistance protein CopC [Gaiellales bacterium]